jgi:hypothetical protein
MPDQAPQPGPDDGPAAAAQPPPGQPGSAALAGPTGQVGPGPADAALPGGGWPGGLDYQALLEALAAGGYLDGQDDDQDDELADELAAEQDGRMGPADPAWTAALAVEHMDPGPAMAGWLDLASTATGRLDENALAGMAAAARRLTSCAQAAELAAVAQITARAAAADHRIGVRHDGRPVRVGRDALCQVALALMLNDYDSADWADLAVTLCWRLPATGAALAAGRIDLRRARLIATATGVLSDNDARQVEAAILPDAGSKSTAQLRKRLSHAVIAADPDAAERRRENAQRHAQVSLYGDDNGTATLTGTGLPAVEAAAAMARITAIARAMKAAGQIGGLDLHRAQVMLGLLLGTLPYIPPAEDAPPHQPPPHDPRPGNQPPGQPSPGGADPGNPDPGGPDPGAPGPGADLDGRVGPDRDSPRGPDAGPQRDGGPGLGNDSGGGWPDDLPAPRDEDAPPDDGLDHPAVDLDDDGSVEDDSCDHDQSAAGPAPGWPTLGVIPPALARPGTPADGKPVPGLLDVTLPWTTLAGQAARPGILGRIGPITPAQARHLADAAANDPAAEWRVIITNPAGQAIAVTRLRRRSRRTRADPGAPATGPPSDGPPGAGLVGRATVTISQDTIRQHTITAQTPTGKSRWPYRPSSPLGVIAAVALQAAARALDHALARAAGDTAADGCAHAEESLAYRPPPRLREQVTARDLTCRFPTCGQPAWRADLDHTVPHDQGGRTCKCNLGGRCRKHHIVKQDPRWKLEQGPHGEFTWTTPAGRTYSASPDTYPL